LIKTDSNGNVEFNKTYGGEKFDIVESVVETSDGGFALAGKTASNLSWGAGPTDMWLVKTDSNGNVEFSETYGGEGGDGTHSVIETSDGGFALAGGGLIKTDSNGNVEFKKTYGGTSLVIETSDGGFALAGQRGGNASLIKTDSNGSEVFSKTFGGEKYDGAESVVETSDGGFAIAGWTTSFGVGNNDVWLVKTDSDGKEQFNKTFGGKYDDIAWSVIETSDGGFALAGKTTSFCGRDGDAWLIKTDSNGNEQFKKAYGGKGYDEAESVVKTSDGGFALAGSTTSFSAEGKDVWLLKVSESGDGGGEGQGFSGSGNCEGERQGLPGFAVVTALLALLTVVAVVVRRRRGT
jgi:hypothetical protein